MRSVIAEDVKASAKLFCGAQVTCCIICGILLVVTGSILGGILLAVFGSVFALIPHSFMRGFAQLIEDNNQMAYDLNKFVTAQEKKERENKNAVATIWRCGHCGHGNNAQSLKCEECGRSKY